MKSLLDLTPLMQEHEKIKHDPKLEERFDYLLNGYKQLVKEKKELTSIIDDVAEIIQEKEVLPYVPSVEQTLHILVKDFKDRNGI